MGKQNIRFGYSPCPNDTFMFWAWAHQKISTPVSLQPTLFDIQELNRLALDDAELELTKVSMATYLDPRIRSEYELLSAGAALGRGCGPLVVSKKSWSKDAPTPLKLAIPGRNTTAFRLTEMALGPWIQEWVELRYDEIMPAVLSGEVEAGVIIHESRFVYRDLGLKCAFDLGQWWEEETGFPLPLGVMIARKTLSDETVREVEQNLSRSIGLAWDVLSKGTDHPDHDSLWRYLRDNAIELDDNTMRSHIELYVNDYSLDLGEEGRMAVEAFKERSSASAR